MQVRTQLAVVGLIAVAWVGGNYVRVKPVLADTREAERLSLEALENRVATRPDNVVVTRVLLRRYLDHGMNQHIVNRVRQCPVAVQRDGAVVLITARAHERLGNVETASALVAGALSRCAVLPDSLREGAGCDVRTEATLSIESEALRRMIEWHITPLSDPQRASVAHELATRPVRITAVAQPR